ncbi:MAG: glycerol-3-phosphate acyltransferase, partial [Acidimicrobiales bacterium]
GVAPGGGAAGVGTSDSVAVEGIGISVGAAGTGLEDGVLKRLAVLVTAYLIGAVPFSNLLAGRLAGVDLRRFGNGTVSGTSLYKVSGFRALATAGILDIAKGASAPRLARRVAEAASLPAASAPPQARWRAPSGLEAAAAGLVVVGHNWSPYLDGAGGRGIAPSVGAYLVVAPEGAVLLLGGLTVGRLVHHSGIGTLAGQLAVIPVLRATRGRQGALAGLALVAPMLAKRVMGNSRPASRTPRVYLARLLFDRDSWSASGGED